jgi:hypothetical protein
LYQFFGLCRSEGEVMLGAIAVTLILSVYLAGIAKAQGSSRAQFQVRMSWGYTSPNRRPFYVKLLPTSSVQISKVEGTSFEPGEGSTIGALQSEAGIGSSLSKVARGSDQKIGKITSRLAA